MEKNLVKKGEYWLEGQDLPVNLSLAENPVGPPISVKRRLSFDISHYPDSKKLIKALSFKFSIPEKSILVGAGIIEFLYLIPQVFLKKGDFVLMPKITYPTYKKVTKLFGGKPVSVPMEKTMRIDFDAFSKKLRKIKPRLVFIANPNNPTGLFEEKEKILSLVRKSKSIFIIDEAGIDFEESYSLISEAPKFKNLIVLRSFSKGYGMTGLRIGFCVSCERIIEKLSLYKIPFSLSSVAIEAAILALKENFHLKRVKKFFKRENEFLAKSLRKLGFKVLPIESNSILAKINPVFRSSQEFLEELRRYGANCVDGRHFDLPKFIRICPRNHLTNQKFIDIITKIVRQKVKILQKSKIWKA
jgi:histidinol-phosphate aminotransferase